MSVHRLLKRTRHFGKYPGKMYQYAGDFTRSDAAREARMHRSKGKLVRVTYRRSTGRYEVWTR